MLSNQYRILERLYPQEAESLASFREIVENGYELHYSEISQHIYDQIMTPEECREALDILEMFEMVRRAYVVLEDKSGIEKHRITFMGFDGNDKIEVSYMAYARFFCSTDGGRYKDLARGDSFNSHIAMLERYRNMLSEWRKSKSKYELTKDDLIRIASV